MEKPEPKSPELEARDDLWKRRTTTGQQISDEGISQMQRHPTTPAPGATGAAVTEPSCSSSERSKIERAAMWLADQRDKPAQIIPILKAEFDLSAVQACEAIAMARRMEIVRRAFA